MSRFRSGRVIPLGRSGWILRFDGSLAVNGVAFVFLGVGGLVGAAFSGQVRFLGLGFLSFALAVLVLVRRDDR